MPDLAANEPEAPPARGPSTWAWRVFLAVLPIALALVGWYRPWLEGAPLPRLGGDGAFYVYQLTRASELNGQWWKMGSDDLVGGPYQAETAKHPGIYEGVDLMLLSVVTGKLLGPTANYHAMVLAILAVNGWIAAWLAFRLTRSHACAALAILLITLNLPTALRLNGHLHLYKYGWVLLATWAFFRYLETPSRKAGLWLGLAVAWVLQGSFYYGFLLGMGFAAWWLLCLVGGRLDRRHVGATLAAGAAFSVAGAALTFPVWAIAKQALLADQYFHRSQMEVWMYSSELWQYFQALGTKQAAEYIRSFGVVRPGGTYAEGWNYPGRVVLLGVAAYAAFRLRGRRPSTRYPRFLDTAMGLMGVFVVISLSGGPSYFTYKWVGSFRCYGRAGMLAMALGCVAAPAVLQGVLTATRRKALRPVILAAVAALGIIDARYVSNSYGWFGGEPDPAWATWLAKQPANVHLAAFGPSRPDTFNWWGTVSIYQRALHRHATLNGCEFLLLEADLKLLGASYDRMNPDGLRMVVSLGYETIGFQRATLAANPWLYRLNWLDFAGDEGDWQFFRANDRTPRYPTASLGGMLAGIKPDPVAEEVPAHDWITGRLDLGRDTVVDRPAKAFAVWEDAKGRRLGKPTPALFQHVFGPNLPAFTIRTPQAPGAYRLVFLDEARKPLTWKAYRVSATLRTSRKAFGDRLPDIKVAQVAREVDASRGATSRLVFRNSSPYYVQAHADRFGSARAQPGMYDPAPGSMVLVFHATPTDAGQPERFVEMVLPGDLPPGGQLAVDLPSGWLAQTTGTARVEVTPMFRKVGQVITPADQAAVRAEVVEGQSPQIATPGPAIRR